MAEARHLGGSDRVVGRGLRSAPGGGEGTRRPTSPRFRRIDLHKGKLSVQEFADDFLTLHHEQAERLAVFLFLQRAQAGEVGFREGHAGSRAGADRFEKQAFKSLGRN